MATRYNNILAYFECVGEDKEKLSKIILRHVVDDDTIISFTTTEARVTPEIVSVNSPINLRFVE